MAGEDDHLEAAYEESQAPTIEYDGGNYYDPDDLDDEDDVDGPEHDYPDAVHYGHQY